MREGPLYVWKTAFGGFRAHVFVATLLAMTALTLMTLSGEAGEETRTVKDPQVKRLYNELADKGWIVYSARNDQGYYNLFISRPNGTGVRNITRTPTSHELGARLFDVGKRIFFRRLTKLREEQDYNNVLREGVLVIANSDGSSPRTLGGEGDYPWATVSPDGKQMACLYRKEGKIRIFDLDTLKVIREMPRQGIFQHLGWSPGGSEFCGTANVEGRDWNIATCPLEGGKRTIISVSSDCCTPDWFPDARRLIFSHRHPGLPSDDGGATAKRIGEDPKASWTMITMADRAGKENKLVVAEQYRHLYFACVSPDNKYVIYSRLVKDGSLAGPMAVLRLADAPLLDGPWTAAQEQYAKNAKRGPILHLDLPDAFHPGWTYARLGGR